MGFSLFINFKGNCREAVAYYAEVFDKELPKFMAYGDRPPDPNFPLSEEAKNWVMYTSLNIGGTEVMFSDIPPEYELVVGNNISPVVSSADKEEVRVIFDRLKKEGTVGMELQETFWSQLYGMVTDKYGVTWQIDHDDGRVFEY